MVMEPRRQCADLSEMIWEQACIDELPLNLMQKGALPTLWEAGNRHF